MNLNQYLPLAMRTAKIFDSSSDNLNHVALGIGSEVGELSHTISRAFMRMPFDAKNIPVEIGDASWYAALLCSIMGWNFEDLILSPEIASEVSEELAASVLGRNPVAMCLVLSSFSGEILTLIKASFAYGKELDTIILKRKLSLLVTTLALLSDLHGFDYCDVVLEMNIEKLKMRFPNKFNAEDALTRMDQTTFSN